MFEAAIYRASGHHRWAVFHTDTCVWYFPAQVGKRAAQSFAAWLNQNARGELQ